MGKSGSDGIFFVDSIGEYDFMQHADHILHILCTKGCMGFIFHNVRYNIAVGDYIILNNISLASDFSTSADCKALIMSFSESFFAAMAMRSNYGFIGQFSLLQNPVMKLSEYDFNKCRRDLERLRERSEEKGHLFQEEMLGHLLMAHALDLYNIHAHGQSSQQVPEHTAMLLHQFIQLLYQGEYINHRNLEHYASILNITPHYLSEVCKKVSGQPASYWIDHFTLYEVIRLLRQKKLPLTEVAERLHFSSLSYFSRYVQKHIGVSPSVYRNRFIKA